MNEIVKMLNCSKTYIQGERTVFALQDVSLSLYESKFHVITGPSGCGKTTLLNILGALDVPSHGDVYYNSVPIYKEMNEMQRAHLRLNSIGFVFQNYGLVSFLTAHENIITPCIAAKKDIDYNYLAELVKVLKIKDRLDHIPAELSGGERQRVAIARALIMKPKLILADEPTGNLDKNSTKEIISYILNLKSMYSLTIVMVTHDMSLTNIADIHYCLDDGKLM